MATLIYVLSYWDDRGQPGSPFGVHSSVDNAKAEAVHHNSDQPLEWCEGATDMQGQLLLIAPLTTWHSKCTATIMSYELDAKTSSLWHPPTPTDTDTQPTPADTDTGADQ